MNLKSLLPGLVAIIKHTTLQPSNPGVNFNAQHFTRSNNQNAVFYTEMSDVGFTAKSSLALGRVNFATLDLFWEKTFAFMVGIYQIKRIYVVFTTNVVYCQRRSLSDSASLMLRRGKDYERERVY